MKVGIIGAGISGLISLKCCKEEGIEAVCFEMTDQLGGLWSVREPEEGMSRAYGHVITNSSKEMTTFGDHPFPDSYPSFLTRNLMYEYILSYCQRFQLKRHIKFKHKVHSLQKAKHHESSGCWEMTVEDTDGKEKTTYKFDAVMICSGIHSHAFIPKVDKMEKFKGHISHSQSYTCHGDFGAEERILVVGNSSSGIDLATDLAKRDGGPVYLSGRTPVAVRERVYGAPFDLALTLVTGTIAHWFPSYHYRQRVGKFAKVGEKYTKYAGYLQGQMATRAATSGEILGFLDQGKVKAVPGISEFREDGVILTDGTVLELDRVFFATGYKVKVPFVEQDVLDPERWQVYRHVWPVNLSKNTLALIGFCRAQGPMPPAFELQARWAIQVFKGDRHLPSVEVMMSNTPLVASNDPNQLIQAVTVPYVSYSAELAGYTGCYPGLDLLIRHPLRWLKVYFGPLYPSVFRLVGPGSSTNAWRVIQTAKDRIHSSNKEWKKRDVVKKPFDVTSIIVAALVASAACISLTSFLVE